MTLQQLELLRHQKGVQQRMGAEQSGDYHVDRSPRSSRYVDFTIDTTPHPDAIPITPYISVGRDPIPTPGPAPTAVMSRDVYPGGYPGGPRNIFNGRSLQPRKYDSIVLDKALKDKLGDVKDRETKNSHAKRLFIRDKNRARKTTPVNRSDGPNKNVPPKFRTIYDAETQMLVVKVQGGGVRLKGFRLEYVDEDGLEKDGDGDGEEKGKEVKDEDGDGPDLEWDVCEM